MTHTIVYVVEDPDKDKGKRQLCEIHSHSRFVTMKWWNRINDGSTNDPEVQMKAAKEQMFGWKQNGPWPNAKFTIEQFDDYGEPL
jgi:hypothetical protein